MWQCINLDPFSSIITGNMKILEAKEVTGGLSAPSKMPCKGYSIPAAKCGVGSKLAKIKGSVCFECYALKGFYQFSNVQYALEKRYKSLEHPKWVEAMVVLIKKQSPDYFRWHDSGDLQGVDHLRRIALVCESTPDCRHWLPTREYSIVEQYCQKYGQLPENLTVRLSAHKVDFPAPKKLASRLGVQTSTVATKKFTCPASKQDNACGDCRLCWNRNVSNVAYLKH